MLKNVSRQKQASSQARKTKSKGQQVVTHLITQFSDQASIEKFKMTVADFIRLLQYERENGQEGPKDVRVSWIEPAEESKS